MTRRTAWLSPRGLHCVLLGLSLGLGAATPSAAADVASILVCERGTDANKGPVVAYYERSDDELAACESGSPPEFCAAADEVEAGMPCASALAALYRSQPESVQLAGVAGGRPLLIVAEDVEGEALATRVPLRPQTDALFTFGDDDAIVGCDFHARPHGTAVAFEQTLDHTSVSDDVDGAPSCAVKFTLFLKDGTPLRGSASVAPGAVHAVPDLSGAAPDASEPDGRTGVRFTSPYFVAIATHRF